MPRAGANEGCADYEVLLALKGEDMQYLAKWHELGRFMKFDLY